MGSDFIAAIIKEITINSVKIGKFSREREREKEGENLSCLAYVLG